MIKNFSIIIIFTLLLSLVGCSDSDVNEDIKNPNEIMVENQESNETEPDSSEPEQVQESEVLESSEPDHSELYNTNYSQYDILSFFEEVVLNIEYSDGTGDTSLVQKWTSPIYYQFYGLYTDTDLAVLNDLFEQLNAISGFPGIYAATSENPENLTLNFLDPQTFAHAFSNVVNGEDAYGATEFWYYTDTNEIYTARIGYRTDLDQEIRNSILIEEIINTLGISDTEIRPDSIVYQYSNENTSLSDVDMIILKILYHPTIQSSMNFDRCAEIIKELYY